MPTLPTDTPAPIGPFSLDEFLSWGVTDVQYELVDGWAVVNPMPNKLHQRVARNLGRLLEDACPAGFEVFDAPLDWVLHPGEPNVRQPDVTVVAIDDDDPRISTTPLLAVEILSPGGRRRDLVEKRVAYAGAGLQHYWVVDPEEPAIVVFAGQGLEEIARATGDQALTISEPLSVTVVPADLLSPSRRAR